MKRNTASLPEIWLASQSARRKSILENLGFQFRIRVADVDESGRPGETIGELAARNARAKAERVLEGLSQSERGAEGTVVIAADTLVGIEGRILGKPANEAEAIESIQSLSGRRHVVFTGLTLASDRFGASSITVETQVGFRKLRQEEIENYARTREPYDKAGAYGIQGLGALFIESIDGSYSNVMGLPIEALLLELEKLCGISVYAWF